MPMLERAKLKLYHTAMGKDFTDMHHPESQPLDFRMTELAYYIWHKGAANLVRGTLNRWRLKQSGKRFFLGKAVKLLFPGYLSVGRNVAIGDYSYISCLSQQGVHLADNVRLKEHTWLQTTGILTNVGVGCSIGRNTYIGPHCVIGAGGGITIGEDVVIGAYVNLLAENHNFDQTDTIISQQGVSRRGIRIERNCWIGNLAIVLDGVTIGEGSIVGAGALVTKSIPPYSVAVGNPARVIRTLRDYAKDSVC